MQVIHFIVLLKPIWLAVMSRSPIRHRIYPSPASPRQVGANITINNTGNISVSSAIGTTANGSISLTATGSESINGPINSNGTGSITLTGANGINLGANLTTSGGNIILNDAVVLTGSPTLVTGVGNITFNGTLDGNFTPTLTSSGTLTFAQAVGGITPLASLSITQSSPGTTAIDGNVTTNGVQIYGNPVSLGGNAILTGSNITITGGVSWSGAYILNLTSSSNIALNGPMSGSSGTLTLSAPTSSSPDITTGANGSVNVGTFNLLNGYWSQNGSLPGFSAANFSINSGSIPANNVDFLRVAGGAGTSGSPYQITDIYGLQGIESNTAFLGLSYKLNNGINASVTSGWNSGAGFILIGANSNPFTGSFNGQSNAISGLTISSAASSDIGLFGDISSAATITNLGLTSANITSTAANATNIGALVGQNNGTITGSYSTGSVNAGNGATNVVVV